MYQVGEFFTHTCSVFNPSANGITFARNAGYLDRLSTFGSPLLVMVPHDIMESDVVRRLPKNITLHPVKNVDYEFVILHNSINKTNSPKPDLYGENVIVHPAAVIGEGVNVANGPDGIKIQMRHMGNVVFGDCVEVGALTLIERGVLDSTTICMGVKIDGRCTIGHNSFIGINTVIATGAVIGGSAEIGKNCWVGLNATVRNGVSICDNVVIGMGACVTKDIKESGVYAGVPAKLRAPYTPEWNF